MLSAAAAAAAAAALRYTYLVVSRRL